MKVVEEMEYACHMGVKLGITVLRTVHPLLVVEEKLSCIITSVG